MRRAMCELMYPKPQKKKKRKHHPAPIVETYPGICYLCAKEGKDAVHNCRATRERLCAYLQEAYEQDHTREEWMRIAYKNYL